MAKLTINDLKKDEEKDMYDKIIDKLSDDSEIYHSIIQKLLYEEYKVGTHYVVVKIVDNIEVKGQPASHGKFISFCGKKIEDIEIIEGDGKPLSFGTYKKDTYRIFELIRLNNERPLGTKTVVSKEFTYDELQQAYEAVRNQVSETVVSNDAEIQTSADDEGEDNINSPLYEKIVEGLDNNKQIILTGAPGTGKTFGIREYVEKQCETPLKVGEKIIKQFEFVQFHSSYDYSDFVEGLRPIQVGGQLSFVRMDGIFKKFCRNVVAYNNEQHQKDTPFYFIIDEINRADIGRVFGELMYCLEESYRGEEHKIPTQYSNLSTYCVEDKDYYEDGADVFKDGFYIPENLYIIGSMNDIDRSVESFDFALRRRFAWIDVKANDVMKPALRRIYDDVLNEEQLDEFCNIIKKLNGVISGSDGNQGGKFGLSEAYHIGPAYFKNYDPNNSEVSRKRIWDTKIESILKEYVRGRKKEDVDAFIGLARKAFVEKNREANNN